MNEICRCPTCKEEIDKCPYCRDYKPVSNKFCNECYELWRAELEEVEEVFKKARSDIDDKYNLIRQKNPLDLMNDKLKEIREKLEEMTEDGS